MMEDTLVKAMDKQTGAIVVTLVMKIVDSDTNCMRV